MKILAIMAKNSCSVSHLGFGCMQSAVAGIVQTNIDEISVWKMKKVCNNISLLLHI